MVTVCHPLPVTVVCPPRRHSVNVCDPFAMTVVCPPRRLCGHSVLSAHRDGSVYALATFRSPGVIRSPRQPCARPGKFAVTACYPLTALAVRLPWRHSGHCKSSAHRASDVLITLSFRPLRTVRSPRWRCACPDNCPIAACNPLSAVAVCSPPRVSSHRLPSASRASGILSTATFRSPCGIRSPYRRCARTADFPVVPVLSVPTFRSPSPIR
jgi:hypothetical protein